MQVMVDRPSFLLAIVDANMDVFLLVTTCKLLLYSALMQKPKTPYLV